MLPHRVLHVSLHQRAKDLGDAQQYCREHYTDLASVWSEEVMLQLTRPSTYAGDAWIGLFDDPASWFKVLGNDSNSWRWSATEDTSTSFPEPGFKNYTFVTTSMTWKNAQSYCREHYTDLAMIEDETENAAVASMIGGHAVWIGLYREPFRWSDGSDKNFTNWLAGEPNNGGKLPFCVLERNGHKWFDVPCSYLYPFHCHRAVKGKLLIMVMKLQSQADLSQPDIWGQFPEKVKEELLMMGLSDLKLHNHIFRAIQFQHGSNISQCCTGTFNIFVSPKSSHPCVPAHHHHLQGPCHSHPPPHSLSLTPPSSELFPPHFLSQCPGLASPSTGPLPPHSFSQRSILTSPSTRTFTSSLFQSALHPNITIYRDIVIAPKIQLLKDHKPNISQSISHLQGDMKRQFLLKFQVSNSKQSGLVLTTLQRFIMTSNQLMVVLKEPLIITLMWFFFSFKESHMVHLWKSCCTRTSSSSTSVSPNSETRLKHQLSIFSKTAIFVPHIRFCLVIVQVFISNQHGSTSLVHLPHLVLTVMCLQSAPAPPGPDCDVASEVHLSHLVLTVMCLQSSPAPPGPDCDVSPEFTCPTWS
ncbi:hypothetical protein WMY93_026954 [Mugilogobius chulae]|uniref:C-type lectin domain-containing protein n=1 Tax=Mugilogobius chulae TaxID=88201 RepID=A0AAW0MTC4_9GOBI